MLGSLGIGHELLGSAQHFLRGLAVVQAAGGQDVSTEGLVAKDLTGVRVGTPPLAVARGREAVAGPSVVVSQAVEKRCVMVTWESYPDASPTARGSELRSTWIENCAQPGSKWQRRDLQRRNQRSTAFHPIERVRLRPRLYPSARRNGSNRPGYCPAYVRRQRQGIRHRDLALGEDMNPEEREQAPPRPQGQAR